MNLYWFRDIANVGDVASFYLINNISNEHIKYKNPTISVLSEVKKVIVNILKLKLYIPSFKDYVFPFDKCLFGVGSILDFSKHNVVNWGTGFRNYDSKFKGGKVLAVRGYLTKKKLHLKKDIPVGDPALLLPLVYKPANVIRSKLVAIIPHYADYDDIKKRFSERYKVLDVRTNDIESFIEEVCKYKYVLSTSLHGLIISHAYGIPAIWIKNGYIYSSDFKFYDYFSSVGIPAYSGYTNIDEILSSRESIVRFFIENKNISLIHADLNQLQIGLLSVAPFKLKSYFKNLITND